MTTAITTESEFKTYVVEQKAQSWYREPLAFGIARIEQGASGNTIKAWIPVINWQANTGSFAVFMAAALANGAEMGTGAELVTPFTRGAIEQAAQVFAPYMDDAANHANVNVIKELMDTDEDCYKLVVLFEDAQCESVETGYLKLLAMSEGFVTPRSINMDGIFGLLPNLAWAGHKPYELDYLRANKTKLQMRGEYPKIDYVDKFPVYLHHVIPTDNTRLLESAKVRLGAHIAPGTTLMPGASYINFNAGTLGPAMVEGRISSSVTVGKGTDVGGGASILGVLSGGNTTPITIGDNCLLGANSVTGIPLGDGCIVDAGTTILEGSKVFLDEKNRGALAEVNDTTLEAHDDNIYKGVAFTNLNGLHFRTDSTTGELKVMRSTVEIKLNEDLH